MDVAINLAMSQPNIKPLDLLAEGSGVTFGEGDYRTRLVQQGTGARRAMFWGLVQVHNKLVQQQKQRDEKVKNLNDVIKKEAKKKEPEQKIIEDIKDEIQLYLDGAVVAQDEDDIALPGNLLLIDEPENALHPLAARLAQIQLFELANDPDWQIVLTTHSPYFINPIQDHTIIVRLDRSAEDRDISPKIYRAKSSEFEGDELARLKAVMQLDTNLAEMFFGSYPVLVEGDTEHAAYLAAVLEEGNEISKKIAIVRARGKALLPALCRILRHFEIPYAVMHDADTPFNAENGNAAAMWTINEKIRLEVQRSRELGLDVGHIVNFQDFEHWLGIKAVSKDKPFNTYSSVKADYALKVKIQTLFEALLNEENLDTFSQEELDKHKNDFMQSLLDRSLTWAAANGVSETLQYKGK